MSDSHRTIVIGAGGHATVIIDILRADPAVDLAGCTSVAGSGCVGGVPVLGMIRSCRSCMRKGSIRHSWPSATTAFAGSWPASPWTSATPLSTRSADTPISPLGKPWVRHRHHARGRRQCGSLHTGLCHHQHRRNCRSRIRYRRSVPYRSGKPFIRQRADREGSFLGTGTQVIDGIAVGAWSVLGQAPSSSAIFPITASL